MTIRYNITMNAMVSFFLVSFVISGILIRFPMRKGHSKK